MKDELRELVCENRKLREENFALRLALNICEDKYEALSYDWDKLMAKKAKKPTKKKAKKKRA